MEAASSKAQFRILKHSSLGLAEEEQLTDKQQQWTNRTGWEICLQTITKQGQYPYMGLTQVRISKLVNSTNK